MFKFPWTNFHELNLDWLLHELKDFESRIKRIEETYDPSIIEGMKEDIDNLKDRVDNVETDIDNIKTILTEHTNQLANAFTLLNEHESRIAALETEIQSVLSEVESIEDDISTLEAAISELTTTVNNHTNELEDHETRIVALEQGGGGGGDLPSWLHFVDDGTHRSIVIDNSLTGRPYAIKFPKATTDNIELQTVTEENLVLGTHAIGGPASTIKVKNVNDPTNILDGVNKQYVDKNGFIIIASGNETTYKYKQQVNNVSDVIPETYLFDLHLNQTTQIGVSAPLVINAPNMFVPTDGFFIMGIRVDTGNEGVPCVLKMTKSGNNVTIYPAVSSEGGAFKNITGILYPVN